MRRGAPLEVETYAEDVILVVAVVVEQTEAVAHVEVLPDVEAEGEVDGKVAVRFWPGETIAEVESRKALEVGAEGGRIAADARRERQLVEVAALVVVIGIFGVEDVPSHVLIELVLRADAHFEFRTYARFERPRGVFHKLLSRERRRSADEHSSESESFFHVLFRFFEVIVLSDEPACMMSRNSSAKVRHTIGLCKDYAYKLAAFMPAKRGFVKS